MARTKRTSRAAPAGSNRGLAGVPRLDPAFAQTSPNQHNLNQPSQSSWVAPDPFDPDFDTLRDINQMPPPPPPAVSNQDIETEILGADYDRMFEHTAMAGADAPTVRRPLLIADRAISEISLH